MHRSDGIVEGSSEMKHVVAYLALGGLPRFVSNGDGLRRINR